MSAKSTELELTCIKRDAEFFLELILALKGKSSATHLSPSLFPYFSLFAWESFQYFGEFFPNYALALSSQFTRQIKASRLRIKLFEDKKLQIEEITDLFAWIIDFHEDMHLKKHTGVFGPLKRALSTDIGIFLYSGHLIGTTHASTLGMGFTRGDLDPATEYSSQHIFDISADLGRFTAELLSFQRIVDLPDGHPNFEYCLMNENLNYVNFKSSDFLNLIFNGYGTKELNLVLATFHGHINFIRLILDNLMKGPTYTLFKLKYLTLFHVNKSLGRLQNYGRPKNLLSEGSLDYLGKILGDKDLKRLTKNKKFRDTLAHYSILDFQENQIDFSRELFGMVEYFFEGANFDEISEQVDFQLERISVLLTEWLNWEPKRHQIRNW